MKPIRKTLAVAGCALLLLTLQGCAYSFHLKGDNVHGDALLVSWDAPKKRSNGQPLKPEDIDHYTVYYSANGQNQKFDRKENSVVLRQPSKGKHTFQISVTDTENRTSPKSEPLVLEVR